MELNEDIKLKLLGGKKTPIKINNIKIIPLTLQEIIDMDYSKYNYHLMNLIAEAKDFNIPDENVTTFDIIMSGMLCGSNNYRDFIIESLGLFINGDIGFTQNGEFIINNGEGYLNKDNYEDFKKVLKWQNGFKEKPKIKFANKRAEEIYNLIEKGKQSLQSKNSTILYDMLSSLSTSSNSLNILDILDLTIYQFKDQLARGKMKEDFYINIESMMAGAQNITLKHYTDPIGEI